MGCGASAPVEKKQYAFRVRLLGGLNLYNNGFGVQVPGTYTNAGRFEGSSDPYCVIECTGTKQKFESKVCLSTQNPVWNQEFYFNTSTKAPIVTITVKDKDVLSADNVLGTVQVNLNGLLSKEKERTMWVPLANSKAGGEIGFSVVEAFRTHITAKQGINVKPMDSLSGSSDVYMTLQVGQQAPKKTSVKGWTLNPVWNETFTFFVPYGIKSQVAMILYDHDSVGVDKNMGWHYLYFDGKPAPASRDLKTPIANAQGNLEFTVVDDITLEAVTEAGPVTEDMKAKFPSEIPTSCTFDVRVLGAYNLAAADHNYAGDFANSVNCWGWHEYKEYKGTSDPFARVTCEGNTYDTRHINGTLEPIWNEQFRFVARNREKGNLKVEVLDHDLAVNDSIGAVNIPLTAMKPGHKQEIWSFLDKGRGEVGVEITPHHQIHVRVVSASGLAAKDMNGMCDPYIKVTLNNIEYQTRVVRDDRNPWFEEEFRFCLPVLEPGIKMRFQCWDSDLMILKKGLSEDLMGQAEVEVDNLLPGLPTEMNLPLAIAGKQCGTLKVILTEEVPIPAKMLDELKKKGKEAFEAACKKMNEAKEMVKMMKLPDFDKKEEAVYEVADEKLAARPRFTKIDVEVLGLRKLKGVVEPYYVGVSLPLQGQRNKTKEYRGKSGADIKEHFSYNVPSKVTGALELSVFESQRHPYLEWSNKCFAKHRLMLQSLNDNDGPIRGAKPDDEWLNLTNEQGEVVGQIIVRVKEMFRFQVRVVRGEGIKTNKEPFVQLKFAGQQFNTSYVSANPEKDRTNGVPGKPYWNEQFTIFGAEKGIVEFNLLDLGITNDTVLGKGAFDLNTVRRGIPVKTEVALSNGAKIFIEVLEEEKMALLDRIFDAAANASKMAGALADELGDAAKDAAKSASASASAVLGGITGGIGKLF